MCSWSSLSASWVCPFDPDDSPLTIRDYNLEKCMVACEVNPSCVAINYVANYSYCTLCTKLSKKPFKLAGVMSYRFNRPQPGSSCPFYQNQQPHDLYSIPGQGRTWVPNATVCRDRCASVDKCVYWTFFDNLACHLSKGMSADDFLVNDWATTGKNPKLCSK